MKKLALVITLAALPAFWLIHAAETKVVVPKGKTYVKLDAKGKEFARYTAGQTMARTVDCAQVPCPSTFGKDVVCWKCKERPVANPPASRQ